MTARICGSRKGNIKLKNMETMKVNSHHATDQDDGDKVGKMATVQGPHHRLSIECRVRGLISNMESELHEETFNALLIK